MSSFWASLLVPFVGASPMDGVTDFPFRYILSRYSRPAVIFTEFVNVEGLCHNALPLLRTLLFHPEQRPIVAQLFGTTPSAFRLAAVLVCQLGFDGIDINMGCPAKNVARHGAGAGLIETPRLVKQIYQSVQEGVADWQRGATCSDYAEFSSEFCQKVIQQAKPRANLSSSNQAEDIRKSLPISIKTRLGIDKPDLDNWLKWVLSLEPAALTVHGRTLTQGYTGQANWELISQLASWAHDQLSKTLIIGNGDLQSAQQAQKQALKYQCDGALIGRAMQGNPWIFTETGKAPQPEDQFAVALEHARLYEQTFQSWPKYSFLPMRKHLAWYIKGIDQAKYWRQALIKCHSADEVEKIVSQIIKQQQLSFLS